MGLVSDEKPDATMHGHLGVNNRSLNSINFSTKIGSSIIASFYTSSFSPTCASYFAFGIASKIDYF